MEREGTGRRKGRKRRGGPAAAVLRRGASGRRWSGAKGEEGGA